MSNSIIWSPLAEKDFEIILNYLNDKWGNDGALKFIDILDYNLFQLIRNPKQYPLINKKMKVRKCVVTKHNTIFYRYSKKHINILRVYDTRQDPADLTFI
ncbi:MAG: type II toxin-antitoxin system RelE/ParE family toxin [Bacteroidales bacterium]|nr:type II toxin-antitoxin system RelE/ParE family toxin [Bacteroidales bacterium]